MLVSPNRIEQRFLTGGVRDGDSDGGTSSSNYW